MYLPERSQISLEASHSAGSGGVGVVQGEDGKKLQQLVQIHIDVERLPMELAVHRVARSNFFARAPGTVGKRTGQIDNGDSIMGLHPTMGSFCR